MNLDIDGLAVGWEIIEPVLLANIALRKPFILIGRHGTSKTTCAKKLGTLYGDKSIRFYDATKDDLVSIAGIPIPQKLGEGKLEFSRHNRTIWEAKTIVVDELSRANKENQNLWLEILQEKTCFGIPLSYEVFIATMNPESYSATFKVDGALLDRFYVVIPVPELQRGTTAETIKALLRMNLDNPRGDLNSIHQKIRSIHATHQQLSADERVFEGVLDYVSNFLEILLSQIDTYISPRRYSQLLEEILALAAYFKTFENGKDFLEKAAETALIYTLSIPLKIKPEILLQIHENLKALLRKHTIPEVDKLRIELSKLQDNPQGIFQFVKDNVKRIKAHLPFDEAEKILGELLKNHVDLAEFRGFLKTLGGHEELLRRVEGKIFVLLHERAKQLTSTLQRLQIHQQKDLYLRDHAEELVRALRKPNVSVLIRNFLLENNTDAAGVVTEFLKREDWR